MEEYFVCVAPTSDYLSVSPFNAGGQLRLSGQQPEVALTVNEEIIAGGWWSWSKRIERVEKENIIKVRSQSIVLLEFLD